MNPNETFPAEKSNEAKPLTLANELVAAATLESRFKSFSWKKDEPIGDEVEKACDDLSNVIIPVQNSQTADFFHKVELLTHENSSLEVNLIAKHIIQFLHLKNEKDLLQQLQKAVYDQVFKHESSPELEIIKTVFEKQGWQVNFEHDAWDYQSITPIFIRISKDANPPIQINIDLSVDRIIFNIQVDAHPNLISDFQSALAAINSYLLQSNLPTLPKLEYKFLAKPETEFFHGQPNNLVEYARDCIEMWQKTEPSGSSVCVLLVMDADDQPHLLIEDPRINYLIENRAHCGGHPDCRDYLLRESLKINEDYFQKIRPAAEIFRADTFDKVMIHLSGDGKITLTANNITGSHRNQFMRLAAKLIEKYQLDGIEDISEIEATILSKEISLEPHIQRMAQYLRSRDYEDHAIKTFINYARAFLIHDRFWAKRKYEAFLKLIDDENIKFEKEVK